MHACRRPSNLLLFSNLQYAHLRVANSIGVVIHIDAFHVSFPLLEIQTLYVILLTLMNVNCLRMQRRQRRRKIHFADDFGPAFLLGSRIPCDISRNINDHEIIGSDCAQADRIRGIRLLHPVPVPSAAM